jgi:hypothetical protein
MAETATSLFGGHIFDSAADHWQNSHHELSATLRLTIRLDTRLINLLQKLPPHGYILRDDGKRRYYAQWLKELMAERAERKQELKELKRATAKPPKVRRRS